MAKKITEGSLICAKRNVEGLGIVLRRVKDINLYAEFDLSEAFLKLYDKNHPDYHYLGSNVGMNSYTLKSDTIDSINDTIVERKTEVDRSALTAFWAHNKAYSKVMMPKKRKKVILKPKVDFCLVHWTKPPSDYGDTPAQWYVKRGPVWMITTSLKNK
jgi:hypothetical protein